MFKHNDVVEWVSDRDTATAPICKVGEVIGVKGGFVLVQFGNAPYNTTRPCKVSDLKLLERREEE